MIIRAKEVNSVLYPDPQGNVEVKVDKTADAATLSWGGLMIATVTFAASGFVCSVHLNDGMDTVQVRQSIDNIARFVFS